MNHPGTLFAMRLNKARHDKAFQCFLAQSFGVPFKATNEEGVVSGYLWRSVHYITKMIKNPGSKP